MRARRLLLRGVAIGTRSFGGAVDEVAEAALAQVQRHNADGVQHFRGGSDEGLTLAAACFSRALRGMEQIPDAARDEQAVLEAATLVNLANVQVRVSARAQLCCTAAAPRSSCSRPFLLLFCSLVLRSAALP